MAPSMIKFQNTSLDGVKGEVLELDSNFAVGRFLDLIDCFPQDAVEPAIIPLKVKASDACLRRVIDWLPYRQSRSEDTSATPASWDGFRSMEPADIFEMSVAASYLNLPDLFCQCSEILVSVLPGLSEDGRRQIFKFHDDFARYQRRQP
ncbi:hypothetical protein B0T19DRAFT_404923 [Cercophora scortea]|uniref:SKP1 component POZ domain-containing protein n=1 Tax=Cercophora scortea TaxID=314031 RepID=A0AAE0I2K3_9PEZI|nr:hypothetical protein B0T19DRAFT_404923 [Cercophora scortea]